MLGRATRDCVNHGTGITCEGVVVSSELRPPWDLVAVFVYSLYGKKELPAAAIEGPRSLSLSPGLGKPHASDHSIVCYCLYAALPLYAGSHATFTSGTALVRSCVECENNCDLIEHACDVCVCYFAVIPARMLSVLSSWVFVSSKNHEHRGCICC